MRPFRMCSLSVLAAGLFISSIAWSQEAPRDPIEEAIQTIKTAGTTGATSTTLPLNLDSARRLLVERRQDSMTRVLELLDNNDPQIRVNAAAVLGEIARAGDTSKTVIDALRRCVDDSTLAIAYWGLQGLMSDTAPSTETNYALSQCLRADRPRPLRLVAATLAGQKNAKGAIPLIVVNLQAILKEYKAQVDFKLGRDTTEARPAAPRERPVAPGELRTPTVEPTARMQALRPMLDPDRMTLPDLEALIPQVESLAAVTETHQMGVILEDLVKNFFPQDQDKLFGFDSTPPWALDQCVEKAVAWLNKNRGAFEAAAPAAPAPTAPAPAAPLTPVPPTPAAPAPAAPTPTAPAPAPTPAKPAPATAIPPTGG